MFFDNNANKIYNVKSISLGLVVLMEERIVSKRPGGGAPDRASLEREAMEATTTRPEKDTDSTESTECEYDWCDGLKSDTLPCFACFDPDREYDVEASE